MRFYKVDNTKYKTRNTKHAILFVLLPGLAACGDVSNRPLSAEVRQRIDSTAYAQINQTRKLMDSLCKDERTARLTFLVDSIKKVREAEIEIQLQQMPR
jgi:hypothetical protein